MENLRKWAEKWLSPTFRAKTEADFYTALAIFKGNWAPLYEYLSYVKRHSFLVERDPDSSEPAYRITMKIFTSVHPIGRFENYDWLLFTDTLLQGVEYIYSTKSKERPPHTVSAFRVEIYLLARRTVQPETPYAPAVYEDFEELLYAGTFPRSEAEKVTNWEHYLNYCENNRKFIFTVCVDKHARVNP